MGNKNHALTDPPTLINVARMFGIVRSSWLALFACGTLIFATACEEEKKPAPASTAAKPPPSAPEAKPSAPVASAPPAEPRQDCPEGSSGEGTSSKPCEGSGTTRLMEVTWTGKIKDDGPSFRVVSKAKREILYGRVVVYFYDKAGKQLEVPAEGESGKPKPTQPCGGNIFGGPMKPDEKAVITFSCVKKEHVPEGTTAIEAEMQMVGFSDEETHKKNEFYWRNKDLTPDARPKSKK